MKMNCTHFQILPKRLMRHWRMKVSYCISCNIYGHKTHYSQPENNWITVLNNMTLFVWFTFSGTFFSWSICVASSSQTNRAAGDGTRKQQRIPEVQGHLGEEQHPCGAPAQRELQQAHPQRHPGWRIRSVGGHHRRSPVCWPGTKDCTGIMAVSSHCEREAGLPLISSCE